MREGFVELEHVFQVLDVDDVDVAVGEGSNVDRGLGERVLAPLCVAEDVALAQERQNLAVLHPNKRLLTMALLGKKGR